MYQVYIVLNTINNKIYIGSTKQSLRKRFSGHVTDSRFEKRRTSRGLARAIYKYGANNFVIEQLCAFDTKESCLEKETELIKHYDSVKKGYNMLHTATIAKTKSTLDKKSDEWKKQMSELRKQKWKDPECRKRMINGRWGNHVKKQKYKAPTLSKKEFSTKIGESNVKRSKTYYFISPSGEEVKVTHLPSFCKEMNLDSTCMCRVNKGVSKQHKGWSRKKWNC